MCRHIHTHTHTHPHPHKATHTQLHTSIFKHTRTHKLDHMTAQTLLCCVEDRVCMFGIKSVSGRVCGEIRNRKTVCERVCVRGTDGERRAMVRWSLCVCVRVCVRAFACVCVCVRLIE